MKLFYLTVLFVVDAVVAGPSRCNECLGTDSASCSSKQKDDLFCASDKDSLGTTHCGSAVGKYLDDGKGENVTDVFFRGCFNCSSKREACFALGGFLKGDERWTLLKCEIECCTSNICNNQFPALSENAITVFTPNASGPAKCYECWESDADACFTDQDDQTCSSDSGSLGTTHCGSAVGSIRDKHGNIGRGFFRSCINCADKKAACALIGGYLKREGLTFHDCEIECCTETFCNRQPIPTNSTPATRVAGPSRCNECLGTDSASCSSKQKDDLFCASDRDSLGTTHCGSAVGKYLGDGKGAKNVTDLFFRGCFNCSSKKEACFALGGFLKGDERWTLLKCEIECCSSNICNNQFPTLSENAITVFTPNASGPAKCYECFENDAEACFTDQDDQTCSSDSGSLGTTHCGSAVGTVRDKKGNIRRGFFRSCINCADKKAACALIGGYLKDRVRSTLLDCEIECCTGNFCNRQLIPTKPIPGTTGHPSMAPFVLGNLEFHAFVLAINIILHFF